VKSLRKKNALLFDLVLFLAFAIACFAAYLLTDNAGQTGAIVSIAVLGTISLTLIFSR
jgi:hypothetical protein